MLFWIVRLRSGLSGCSRRRRGFDQASSCTPVASRAMKNAWETNVNRLHLATSLRCTMCDSMWQLCTEAMVTLALIADACFYMYVVLFDAQSLGSDSFFTLPCAQMHQTAMLVSSSGICGTVPCECSRAWP